MEPLGDQWSNVLLNGIFSNDDTEFMAQLLDNSPLSDESSSVFSSALWPTDDSVTPTYPNNHGFPMFPLFDNINTNYNFSSYSQDSYSSGENYYLNESTRQPSSFSFGLMNNSTRSSMSSINFCFGENKPKEDLIIQGCGVNNNHSQAQAGGRPEAVVVPGHAKHLRLTTMDPEFPLTHISDDNHNGYLMENSKKRPQISSDHVIAQNHKKRNVKPKKSMNVKVNNNNRHSSKTSSCDCSEGGDDDIDNNNSSMNATSQSQSQSQSEDVSYGKGKGSRGSASDPQSLYARERKINDRLKVLQNLVPNGTKVDISTMLEEAVQYVKFLQLQIKLLSSDEHWMYAPIAYNGMDIGLNMKFPIPAPTTTST